MSFNYKDLVSRFPELSLYQQPRNTTMPIVDQRRAIGDMRYQEPRYKMPFIVDPQRAIGFRGKGRDEDIIKQILLIGLQSLMAKSKRKKGGMARRDPKDNRDKAYELAPLTEAEKEERMRLTQQ
jgi:hypothetical protein